MTTDDILGSRVQLNELLHISFRHLAQIGKTNLSDGSKLTVHRHETLLHHGLPLGILVTVKDGA